MHDEPLAAVGVRPSVGHRQRAPRVGAGHFLVAEAVAWPARAVSAGATALDHEAIDDPVKLVVFIEAVPRQKDEVVDGPRSDLGQQLDGHVAFVSLYDGVVPLGRFNDQARLVLVLLGGHRMSPECRGTD